MPRPPSGPDFERPDIVRPPSEWRSYYLPLTSGCSNNSCTFCYYNGCKLRIRDLDDVKAEIDALEMFVNHRIQVPGTSPVVYYIAQEWDGQRVFLQDGDALVYPFPKLVEALRHLNERFPRLDRVATYGTPQDVLRRSPEELAALKQLKLGMVYLGFESGDDAVLSAVGKGVDSARMIEAAKKVKAAGMELSVSLILGLAGVQGSKRHAEETARVLSEMDPEYVGALTLTLFPGTPMYEQARRGEIEIVDPFQALEELRTIVLQSNLTNCFLSSMHASNYFSIRGHLPRDRERVLRELDAVLKRGDRSVLRPEFLRRL